MAQYKSAYTGQQIDTAIDTVYNLAEVATSGDYNDLINTPPATEETDPTVPAWAKASKKPTYTASEVGAAAINHKHNEITNYSPSSGIGAISALGGSASIKAENSDGSIQNLITVTPTATTIHNIVTPTADGDAANKKYVDDAVAGIAAPVTSVNTKTGAVVLTASDVGALPDSTVIPDAQVQSDWNATTGMGAILNKPTIPTVPSNVSAFTNDAGYLTSYTETDPTVPAWAKAANKPAYTAAEVGALPSDTSIPSKVSDLNNDTGFITSAALPTKVSDLDNDAGYLTSYTETDPVYAASAAAGITSTDITNWNSKTDNTGTVTSVRVQATSPVQSSVSTAQTGTLDTTISLANGYGDTKNPYASKTAKYVLAAPNAQNGAPTFRALVSSDLPSIGNITNAGDITTNAAIASGDRLVINDESASKVTNSSITFGTSTTQYLANNGTWQNSYDDTALAARVKALEDLEWATYYSGRQNPASALGEDGDIYLQY